jgi:WD40 repeat protein
LVKDPSFIKDFLANGYKLSEEYENGLALRAKSVVNQYAREHLEGSGTKLESSRRDPQELPKSTFRNSSYPRRRSQPARTNLTRSSSSASEDGGDIFEEQPVKPKKSALRYSTRLREYSSSPATSFSHDAMDYGVAVNLENDLSSPGSDIQTPTEPPTTFRGPPTNTPVVLVKSATPVQSNDAQGSQKGDFPRIKRRRIGAVERSKMPVTRPYTSFAERNGSPMYGFREHIDFSSEEIEYMCEVIKPVTSGSILRQSDPAGKIMGLMSSQEAAIPRILDALQQRLKVPGPGQGRQLLRGRGPLAIKTFLKDAASGTITTHHRLIPSWSTSQPLSRPSILSQLRGRESIGLAPLPFHLGQDSFKEKAMSCLEDSLIRISEWTDCCGDIATISWTGENTFVCGAVAHSDYHNMQYNKPGNLGVGSLALDTLTSISDHRIARPLIGLAENAENALESMRRTQDPWLYTSVVSSSHSETNGFTFTASFDKTVKLWSVSENGSTMDWRGTWEHENNVNFVVTSEYHDRVATAADVCNNAIRVYNFDEGNISDSPYDTYSGDRAREQAQELFRRDKWAYFPATVQWGKAPSVSHLLLVGYSPRSVTGHDMDIPEEKRNTGELCIWDVDDTSKVSISSARSQNVFEVIWHPTQPFFVAATSPAGHFETDTRTQIRLFARKGLGAFFHIKTMDCPALDINELTIM